MKKKTTKQEKLLRLGRKRQGYGSVFAEKFIPAVAVSAVICLILSFVLHDLVFVFVQAAQQSTFEGDIGRLTENLALSGLQDPDTYEGMLTEQIYINSSDEAEAPKVVYKIFRRNREIVRTEKKGIAVVMYIGRSGSEETVCYADASCFDEAYEKLAGYRDRRLSENESNAWYELSADTIYADVENGIFVPGKMSIEKYTISEHQPVQREKVEEIDLTPADTTGLKMYHNSRYGGNDSGNGCFRCGMVYGIPADDEMFRELDRKDKEAGAYSVNGYISSSVNSSEYSVYERNMSQAWFRRNLYTPDGTLYTVTSLNRFNFGGIFRALMIAICIFIFLVCLITSLIRAGHTYNVYKAHYAMEDYRRDMTNTLAHDLKTPLMAISGCAEMLGEGADADKQKKYSDMIRSNVEYMNGMINNVLELSKLESGGALNRESFDMRAAADSAAEKYGLLADERNVRLTVNGEGTIDADRQLMTQVMDNLLSNAVKYTSEGGNISIDIGDKGFTVKNDISHKPKRTVGKLMKPFVKDDDTRSGQTGSGLGLYIVKSICDRHGFECIPETGDDYFKVKIVT